MFLASVSDIKQLGFGGEFWGIEDVSQNGEQKSQLDLFLEDYLWEASQRLIEWVGTQNYEAAQDQNADANLKRALKRAELCLALAEILPVAWSRAGTGEESISFEGMSIRIARASENEQQVTLHNLLQKAERITAKWSADTQFGGVLSV